MQEYVISYVGAKGDGFADNHQGGIHIPYVLAGERVLAEEEEGSQHLKKGTRATLIKIIESSPHRIEAICPLFTRCGGCVMQHADRETYQSWKKTHIETQLKRAGLDTYVEPLQDAHGLGRRRVTFHARFDKAHKDGVMVGFMAAGSHNLIEVLFCPILESGMKEASFIARQIAKFFSHKAKTLDIVIVITQSGFDIDLRGIGVLSEKQRLGLIELSNNLDLARLSNHGDVIIERRAPVVIMGASAVVPAPGAFLQATSYAEQVMAEHIVAMTKGSKRIADLFSGSGPFTLRLAHYADVHAVEGERAMLQTLDRAARATSNIRRVTTEQRDLFRRPLLITELNNYDALVLDPPRAGAEAQCQQLAKSSIPIVVSVSCDAVTFARDAALLVAGGYNLETVIPIDQFKYSAHVEIIGLFKKQPQKRRKSRV